MSPSLACATCKKRRIKCDFVQPICSRCNKADRRCVWITAKDASGLTFKDENPFAKGQARRPRTVMPTRNHCHALTIPSTLCEPTETHALNFWVRNWTDKPSAIPDIGHEYLTYIPSYLESSQQGSSLRLALSALSLTVFGRLKGSSQATAKADQYYAQVIKKVYSDIDDLSNVDFDELVLATMVMTHFETSTYKQSRQHNQTISGFFANQEGADFWRHACHYLGTAGLLKARQQQSQTQNLSLYRAVRRPIVRAAVLRGTVVQSWLQDAAAYGEETTAQRLDALMIQVAEIRCKALKLQKAAKSDRCIPFEAIKILLDEALVLDSALCSWPCIVSEDYGYSTFPFSTSLYDGVPFCGNSAHKYKSFSHAAVWNRFRAVRMVVNSLLVQLSTALIEHACATPFFSEQLQKSLAEIRALSNDMSQSIPFFFNFKRPATENIIPKVVTTLAWPLTLAIGIRAVPDADLRWFRWTLQTVAETLGDGVLEQIAQGHEFEF